MNDRRTILFAAVALTIGVAACIAQEPGAKTPAPRAETPAPQTAPPATQPAAVDEEAAYAAAITKRAGDHVAALQLDDPAKAGRVQAMIVHQYRSLRDIHARRDAESAQIKAQAGLSPEQIEAESKAAYDRTMASLKTLHDAYLAKLAERHGNDHNDADDHPLIDVGP